MACMTKQEVEKLLHRFHADADKNIQLISAYADTVEGRLVCIWEAGGSDELVRWLSDRQVRLRGDSEWLFKVQLQVDLSGSKQ